MIRKKYIRWVPAVAWMGVIFYLSAQPSGESSELSKGVMRVVIQTIGDGLSLDKGMLHQGIRKGAHLGAYFVLAVLVMSALEAKHRKSTYQIGITLAICFGYAISDEVHQLYVPGRSGEVRDVMIDTAGAALGILSYIVVRKIFKQLKKSKQVT